MGISNAIPWMTNRMQPQGLGVKNVQRLSAQAKILETLTTSSIYLQVMRQIQDVLECIFILDHGVEVVHGPMTSHLSEVTPYPGRTQHLLYTHCQAEHGTNAFDIGKGIVISGWRDQW